MGKNSIHSNLTKDDIIAEIRLTLSADFDRNHAIVVVEGEDDISFFNGKLSSNVDIHESFSGKQGVLDIVSFFQDSRVVGICDADYTLDVPSQQILYYDYSCLEMMLISSNSAFIPFLHVYYRDNADFAKIRFKSLQELKWISCYRRLNSIFSWGISFNGLSMAKAFDPKTHGINIPEIVSQINALNPRLSAHIPCQVEKVYIEYSKESNLSELLSITQGHDFLNYFHELCLTTWPSNRKFPSNRELSRSLLASFRQDDFKETILYQQLSDYQDKYHFTILSA